MIYINNSECPSCFSKFYETIKIIKEEPRWLYIQKCEACGQKFTIYNTGELV